MVTSLASVANLATRVGETIAGADENRAQWYLDTASALIRSYVGQTWLNDAGDGVDNVPDSVARVCVEVAARVWFNPESLTYEGTGPFVGRRPDEFADGFFLTATDKTLLSAFRGSSTIGGLWTIQQTKGDWYDPNVYVPVSPQPGESVPYFVPGTPGAYEV